ncbi:MAG: DUF4124 domain-containing protein [Brachymonas sp.]
MASFHVKHVFLAGFLACITASAQAQKMYRCPSPGGGTTFTDTPCTTASGGEISVKPAAGAAGRAPTQPDPQTRGAMNKRDAEYDAQLSPECRRARQAFQTKADQPGGMDELMKEGNSIFKAWENCQGQAKNALDKLQSKEQERLAAEQRQRAEQDRMALRKSECAAKQKVLDERRARGAQLSEADRAALRNLENDMVLNCR